MRILQRLSNPADFLARTERFLRAAEAENVLMLGICETHAFDDSCYLATVEEDEAVVACALRTPPHSALLARVDREGLELLVADLFDKYPDLPRVAGPEPTVGLFAELWSAFTGVGASLAVRMRVFEARDVIHPPQPSGRFRAATEADMPAVAPWAAAFYEEVGLHDPGDATSEQIDEGRLFVWEDERPVSMVAWAGRTGRTVRINSVYTPPDMRGRGYASACVAHLTRRLLDEGLESVCLYTDLANPTSNKIYQAIGYRPVCDAGEYRIEAGQGAGQPDSPTRRASARAGRSQVMRSTVGPGSPERRAR
jgi:predicted GNAT family acetyltransferase